MNDSLTSNPVAYLIEPEILERLRAVERRLYAPEKLTEDQRRDLANAMNALLHTLVPFNG